MDTESMRREARRVSRAGALIVAILAVGCAPAPAPALPTAKAGAATPAGDEWAAASWEQKHDTMTWRVLPHFGRAFQKFKREPSPSLGCTSCHGEDAEAVAYKMPHGLPPLDPKAMPDPKEDPGPAS